MCEKAKTVKDDWIEREIMESRDDKTTYQISQICRVNIKEAN